MTSGASPEMFFTLMRGHADPSGAAYSVSEHPGYGRGLLPLQDERHWSGG